MESSCNRDIKFGESPNEKDGSAGESATQKTTVYRIPLDEGSTMLRFIDTPGIGDTRGCVNQDALNMEDNSGHFATH